jgi:superfamily II DNA or RNA helicase
MRGGDFAKGEMAARVDKPTITGDAVQHYKRICPGKPAIAFCASVEHAKHVAAEFRAAGFRADSIDGELPDAERVRMINGLANGSVHVLTSCEIVSEGTDIPVVVAAILLRPTQSLGLYLQQVGRALRPAPGKDRAIILDHVGNCLRHGLPDEDRDWSLDGMEKNERGAAEVEPPVRVTQCEKCYAVYQPAPKCPHCGHQPAVALMAPKQVDGELAEITAEQIDAMRAAKRREVGRARSLEDLQRIARERGYRPNWAHIVWNQRQKASA